MRASVLAPLVLFATSAAAFLQPQDSESESSRDPAPLETPAPTIPLRPAALTDLEGLDCARCHVAVASEWSQAAHALAWLDEEYQDSIRGKRRPQACHACHIPQPLLTTGTLPQRVRPRDTKAEDAHFGVNCVTCHAGPDDTILGPRGTETDAHTSVRSSQFQVGAEAGSSGGSNALCSTCHATNIGPVIGVAKDFMEADLASRGMSCVGCHMAPVERRWANAEGADPDADESVPLRKGRSHALQTPRDPAFLRRAFGWSLAATGDALMVVLENRAGHRVPGLIGRFLTFHVTSLDAGGAELATESFTLDTSAYLPVDGTYEVKLAADAVAARIVGEHEDPRADDASEFLRLTLEE